MVDKTLNKLASRMTYLAFGVLAGAAIAIAFFTYTSINISWTEAIQLWAVAFTAVASGLSAFAAYQAASVANSTQRRMEEAVTIQMNSAKTIIRNVHHQIRTAIEANKKTIYSRAEAPVLREQATAIESALATPISHAAQLALYRALSAIRVIEEGVQQHGKVSESTMKYVFPMLAKTLKELAIKEKK